jgi:hypothetical protein
MMRLEAYTGEVGPDGLVIPDDTGTVGGFFEASWSNSESLVGSFTAPCSFTEIEQVE